MAGENKNGQDQVQQENPETVSPVEDGTNERTYIFLGNYGMIPPTGPISEEYLKIVTRQYAIRGVIFTIVGIVAIVFPFLFGSAFEQLSGWLLVLGGVGVILVQFVILCGSPGTFTVLLLGAMHFCVGLWLLLKPLEGLKVLTFIFSAWFLAHGVLKAIMAWQVRHIRSWPAVWVSGLLSIILGFLIFLLTPTYGLKVVGIIYGAELTASGIILLVITFIVHCRLTLHDVVSGSAREPLLQTNSNSRPAEAPPA